LFLLFLFLKPLLDRFIFFDFGLWPDCDPGPDWLLDRARAALAQPEPVADLAAKLLAESKPMDPEMAAVLTTEARWDLYEGSPMPQPEPVAPTDEELLELMPETMRDEFSYAAKVCSDATGGQVKPGIFRVCLNHTALEYARAVLAKWGHQ